MKMNKKSELIPWLEKDSALLQLPPSNEPTLAVVDFMMLLRMVCTETSAFETFGELSDLLLQVIRQAATTLYHGQERNLEIEPSQWPAQLYGTVYQQQFVKLTACIRSDASSKRTCLLCVLMTD